MSIASSYRVKAAARQLKGSIPLQSTSCSRG
jgi:hypothetical protein